MLGSVGNGLLQRRRLLVRGVWSTRVGVVRDSVYFRVWVLVWRVWLAKKLGLLQSNHIGK